MEEATYVVPPIVAVETECGPRIGAGSASAKTGFFGSLMLMSTVAGAIGIWDSGPALRSSPVQASRHLGWTVIVPAGGVRPSIEPRASETRGRRSEEHTSELQSHHD